jgi:hypothetical protein
MKNWTVTACALMAAVLLTTSCAKSTRRVWLTISAEQGEGATIAEIYIDTNLVCNIENLAEFTSPDKARQVGYFPLTAGNHTIEVKAEGFKPLSKTLHIITGEEGVQNMHLHLERNEKSR